MFKLQSSKLNLCQILLKMNNKQIQHNLQWSKLLSGVKYNVKKECLIYNHWTEVMSKVVGKWIINKFNTSYSELNKCLDYKYNVE